MKLLVTVGTTQFDTLITSILDETVLALLKDLNVQSILLQIGRSDLPIESLINTADAFNYLEDDVKSFSEIQRQSPNDATKYPVVAVVRFTSYLPDLMKETDVLICHAGAGTLLEALHFDCKILAVSNPALMRNHQVDLGAELADRNYVQFLDGSVLKSTSTEPFTIAINSLLTVTQSLSKRDRYRSVDKEAGRTFLRGVFQSEIASLRLFNHSHH